MNLRSSVHLLDIILIYLFYASLGLGHDHLICVTKLFEGFVDKRLEGWWKILRHRLVCPVFPRNWWYIHQLYFSYRIPMVSLFDQKAANNTQLSIMKRGSWSIAISLPPRPATSSVVRPGDIKSAYFMPMPLHNLLPSSKTIPRCHVSVTVIFDLCSMYLHHIIK